MLKYVNTQVVFREIPDETSLAINISGCPIHCPDCHSKNLWEDIGKDLTERVLNKLIQENPGITCVIFMGGDNDPDTVGKLCKFIKINYINLKTAWYSGKTFVPKGYEYLDFLDYIKLGPYITKYGSLDDYNTNQRLYKLSGIDEVILPLDGTTPSGRIVKDITYKFWNKEP